MSRVLIIAEAGVNHNGDLETAKRLVDVAVDAGADIVKFQTFVAERLVCKYAQKAAYQMETTDRRESQFDMLKRLELTDEMHLELMKYCEKKGIEFLSTPFDIASIELLTRLNVKAIKIPSGEITNFPYLRKAAETGKKIIMSTGMSSYEEIDAALKVLRRFGNTDIAILHCNTQYPTPMRDVNLKVIPMMKERFGVEIGYSDHTNGIEVPIAAVAMGAVIIEKHFTLDKNMSGPDHKASLVPMELAEMVRTIRNIEKALGSSEKKVTDSERDNLLIVRKSIVAAEAIKKGERFTEKKLTVKRPGDGISPMKWEEVLRGCADRDYREDEQIML